MCFQYVFNTLPFLYYICKIGYWKQSLNSSWNEYAIRVTICIVELECIYELMNFSKKSTSARLSEESSAPRYLEADPRIQYEKYMSRLLSDLPLSYLQ